MDCHSLPRKVDCHCSLSWNVDCHYSLPRKVYYHSNYCPGRWVVILITTQEDELSLTTQEGGLSLTTQEGGLSLIIAQEGGLSFSHCPGRWIQPNHYPGRWIVTLITAQEDGLSLPMKMLSHLKHCLGNMPSLSG